MEAIVLCGGFATRLEPVSFFMPKPLLPVGNRPIIDYIVDSLQKIGVKRIIISTNKKFAGQFKYWMANRKASGLQVPLELVVEPTMKNEEKFGAVNGINYAIKSLQITDDVIIVAGDNYYSFDLISAFEKFKKLMKPTVVLCDIKSKEEAKRFGVAVVKDHKIEEFEEKPAEPKTTIVSTGIYMLPADMLKKFDEYILNRNNPDAPGHFMKWLVTNSKVYGFECNGEWFDIGTIDTYKKVFDSHNESGD